MKYLSPEIEALYKPYHGPDTKSLVHYSVSCGIFQEIDYCEERPKIYRQNILERNKNKAINFNNSTIE